MSEQTDWCKFFQKIEADPTGFIEPLTIREYRQAGDHVSECQECAELCDRVLAKDPGPQGPIIGLN